MISRPREWFDIRRKIQSTAGSTACKLQRQPNLLLYRQILMLQKAALRIFTHELEQTGVEAAAAIKEAEQNLNDAQRDSDDSIRET